MEPDTKSTESDNELYLLLNDARFLLGFIWRSFKRHIRLIIVVFIAVVVLSVALYAVMPRTFEVSARLLIHPSGTLAELLPREERASATELIRARENLREVVEELDLVTHWQANRSLQGRLKDHVMTKYLKKEISSEAMAKALTDVLTEKLRVWLEHNVVSIVVHWNDPDLAFKIIEKIIQKFREEQFRRENTQYLADIAKAERRLKRAEDILKIAEARYRSPHQEDQSETEPHIQARRRVHEPRQPENASTESDVNRLLDANIEEMQRELSLKQREIEILQNTYRQRLIDAKNRLAELKITMGSQHPEVIKAERLVDMLSNVPAAIKMLQDEEEAISARIDKRRNQSASRAASTRHRRRIRTSHSSSSGTHRQQLGNDEEIQARFSEYEHAKMARNTVEEELLNARIQYEAAKGALNYRYEITQPPIMPEGPIKPNPKTILAAAFIGGLFLGLFLSVFLDIKSGTVFESWQVSRILQVPVLGVIEELEAEKKAINKTARK